MVFVLFLPFDLIEPRVTPTETSLFKQYVAGEGVDLVDVVVVVVVVVIVVLLFLLLLL